MATALSRSPLHVCGGRLHAFEKLCSLLTPHISTEETSMTERSCPGTALSGVFIKRAGVCWYGSCASRRGTADGSGWSPKARNVVCLGKG